VPFLGAAVLFLTALACSREPEPPPTSAVASASTPATAAEEAIGHEATASASAPKPLDAETAKQLASELVEKAEVLAKLHTDASCPELQPTDEKRRHHALDDFPKEAYAAVEADNTLADRLHEAMETVMTRSMECRAAATPGASR
jgi:hypothetical protein